MTQTHPGRGRTLAIAFLGLYPRLSVGQQGRIRGAAGAGSPLLEDLRDAAVVVL